jgi:hypothetical protein
MTRQTETRPIYLSRKLMTAHVAEGVMEIGHCTPISYSCRMHWVHAATDKLQPRNYPQWQGEQ